MALYHCHMQIINRASGRSAVAAAAYRAGEKLHNEYDGLTHDFTKKAGILYSEIILPEKAPAEYYKRSELWNAVEKSERRKDAQTAREIEVALPKQLSTKEQIALTQSFIQEQFTSQGFVK
jgi:ATP-dependent exoDNAse (exonuclease V) alpha subunit